MAGCHSRLNYLVALGGKQPTYMFGECFSLDTNGWGVSEWNCQPNRFSGITKSVWNPNQRKSWRTMFRCVRGFVDVILRFYCLCGCCHFWIVWPLSIGKASVQWLTCQDCDQREADEGVRRDIRNVFYQAIGGSCRNSQETPRIKKRTCLINNRNVCFLMIVFFGSLIINLLIN